MAFASTRPLIAALALVAGAAPAMTGGSVEARFRGDSPIVTLDGTRKTVAVAVDFSNDKKLGARFPLGTAALKRCP